MSESQVCCPACGFDVATPVTRFTSAPSPFSVPINTNGRVSTSDDDLLSNYLQGVRADISTQDDVILRLKSALTRAENERDRLQGVFDSHAALRSPFQRCPPEVLTEILHLTIATPSGGPPSLRGLNAGLSKISAVCRLWRTTVLSNPFLWARFRLFGDSRSKGLMSLLRTVLDRSRDASLNVYCHPQFDFDAEDAFARHALGTSQRWKHARIKLSTESNIDLYAQIRGRLPRLEWLELIGHPYDGSQNDPRIDAFEDAPQLRALVLDGRIPVQKLVLPWTQIISLDIRYVNDRDYLSVLSMTPNLQVLTIDSRAHNQRLREPEGIVTCLSLRRIHVDYLALLQSFNFPSLEELAVKDLTSDIGAGNDDKKAEDIFYDFLELSGSPIKKLKLAVHTNVTDFPRIFDMAFRLVDLDITLPSPTTAILFFQALLSTGDKTDVLPELRSLRAECRTMTHVKDLVEVDDIADMIVSRYHPPDATVLQSVHITLPHVSLLRQQSFQARLKKLPDFLSLISTRDEMYTSFICMVR